MSPVNRVKSKPVDSVPVNGGMASSTDVINEYGESQRNEPYRDAGTRGV
jgi:hypothetical protein